MIESVSIIFIACALASVIALWLNQPLIVAYILVGTVAGPHISGAISEAHIIEDISHVGIMFLLFLLGLNLEIGELKKHFSETVMVTLCSSAVFFIVGLLFGYLLQIPLVDTLLSLIHI